MRKLLIIIGILVIVVLGFWFLSNMTGNTITGAVVEDGVIENEYFRIDDDINREGLNESQNSSG